MARNGIKWQVNEAITSSTLPPFARLLMLVLSDLADAKTGKIPPNRTPSLDDMAAKTGMSKASVVRHKTDLVALGWLEYDMPTRQQMSAHETGTYTVAAGRNPEGNPGSHSETPDEKSNGPRSKASGSQGETAPGSQSETPKSGPGSHSETAGVSQRDPAGSHSETAIRNRPTEVTEEKTSATADAVATRHSNSKASTKKGRSPKSPDPIDATAQELTVAFVEKFKGRNVQTFVSIRGVVKTALQGDVPRDVLAHALNALGENGMAISGKTLTIELGRMWQIVNGPNSATAPPGAEVAPFTKGNVVAIRPTVPAPRQSATGRALAEIDAAFVDADRIIRELHGRTG